MRLPPKWLNKPASKLVDAFRASYNAKHETTLETSHLCLESKAGALIDHGTPISDALQRACEEDSVMCDDANFLIRAVTFAAGLSSAQSATRSNPPILAARKATRAPVATPNGAAAAPERAKAARKQSANAAVKSGFLLRKTGGDVSESTRRTTTRRAQSPSASRAAGVINHLGAAGASGVLGKPADAFTRRCLAQAQEMIERGAFLDAADMLGEATRYGGAEVMEVHFLMGVVRTQLGQLFEAAGSYERARDLCGGDRPITPQTTQWQNIVHNLVLVLLDLERREDAQVHARRAAEIAATDAEKWCVVLAPSRARARSLRLDASAQVRVRIRRVRGDRRRRGGARV